MTVKQRATKKKRPATTAGARKAKTPKRKTAARHAGPLVRKSRSKAAGRSGAGGIQRFFPKLLSPKADRGEGVLLVVAIRGDTELEIRSASFEQRAGASCGRKRKRSTSVCPNADETARLLRGLAHAERLHILDAMCQGARKHIEIKAVVGLAAGPLYHHLRELERSGLIKCPSRNDYVLTESGRCALFLVGGLGALTTKSRGTTCWKSQHLHQRLTKPSARRKPRSQPKVR